MTTAQIVVLVVAICGVLHGPLTPALISLFTKRKASK